jgi:OmpA-OmpF porin, OOP family
LIATVIAATATPISVPAAEAGFYFGAGAGQAKYDVSQEELDDIFISAFEAAGANVLDGASELDDADTAFGVIAGYRFNPYFAVEATYFDLGTADYDGEALVDLPGPLGLAVFEGGITLESTGPAVSALAIWPVAEEFDLYARVGLFFSDTEAKIALEDESDTLSGSDEDVWYGVGGAWNLGEQWSVRLDYQRLQDVGNEDETGEGNVDTWSLGILFRL